jgi:hypothetical protein
MAGEWRGTGRAASFSLRNPNFRGGIAVTPSFAAPFAG